ncbi:MAG: hypothetical protein ACRENK_16425 [Gemmatimonadaceae bacterium]
MNGQAPLVDFSAFDSDDESRDEGPICDVIELNPVKMGRLAAKGTETTIARIRIERWNEEGKRVRLPGEWPPQQVTSEWIRQRWGDGQYQVVAINRLGQYLASNRLVLEQQKIKNPNAPGPVPLGDATAPAFHPMGASALPQAPSESAFMQTLLLTLLQNRQVEPDSMRESMAAFMKMMAMQMQMQMMKHANPAEPVRHDSELVSLLRELATQSNRQAAPVKREPSFTDVLPMLQMGMNLGARMAGNGGSALALNPEDQIPAWLKVMPQIADTVGVPLILAISQGFLPPEKAQLVAKVVEEHQQARRAEAEADAAAADADETEEP